MSTKHLAVILFLFTFLVSCEKGSDEPNPDGSTGKPSKDSRSFTASWVAERGGAGGIQNPESFKNFQLEYEVEGNNQSINYRLTSADLDVSFFLFDANGARVYESETGRSVGADWTLNAGKYRIVVMAERNGLGKFSLVINGINKDIVKIPSSIVNTGNKTWSEQGGGGLEVTYRNHVYTFEVTENNSYVDVEMFSNDTEIGLYLFDQTQLILYAEGQRSRYLLGKLNKGTYTIMAATALRGSRGNYQLNLYGKVENLLQRQSQEKVINGNWANGKSVDQYTFEVTANNSVLDVELSCPDYGVSSYIVNDKGATVGGHIYGGGNYVYDIVSLPAGTYQIYVAPNNSFETRSGNYKLVVSGLFK